jgi:heptosyltransferase-1
MKILIVRLSSLGDVLHLFPAISDLRRHVPNAEIHWLVEPAFSELAGWHSAIDKVIEIPLRSHKKIWWKIPALIIKLRKQLRAEKYDIVLDAQGLLKSAILARLAGTAVYGFAASSTREPLASWFYTRSVKVPKGIHVIEKNRQLVKECFAADIAQPADFGLERFRQLQMQVELPESLNEITNRPSIVLLHGTTWNSKYWPEPYWVELIGLLEQQGWRCLLPWGNEDERLRAHRLLEAGNGHSRVLPKLALAELAGVLLRARAFISVETGIGHMAAVLEVPGVMLHGPTDPSYSGIMGTRCRHITSGIYCSPCFQRNCPRIQTRLEVPPCQQAIRPSQVLNECLALTATTA